MLGIGREWGMLRSEPRCSNAEENASFVRHAASDSGGLLISPCRRTRGLSGIT